MTISRYSSISGQRHGMHIHRHLMNCMACRLVPALRNSTFHCRALCHQSASQNAIMQQQAGRLQDLERLVHGMRHNSCRHQHTLECPLQCALMNSLECPVQAGRHSPLQCRTRMRQPVPGIGRIRYSKIPSSRTNVQLITFKCPIHGMHHSSHRHPHSLACPEHGMRRTEIGSRSLNVGIHNCRCRMAIVQVLHRPLQRRLSKWKYEQRIRLTYGSTLVKKWHQSLMEAVGGSTRLPKVLNPRLFR